MRKKHKEITEQDEVERLLHETDVCHLALMDGDYPYVVPMHFGYADGRLYMHSAPPGTRSSS
jgi:nitroimidazol reductase NimA-like FMN-containing flavoprotein (pyridoxamine 5'-phosphate oxidase superfamily)